MPDRDETDSSEPTLREIVDQARGSEEKKPKRSEHRQRRNKPSRVLRVLIGLALFAGGLTGVSYSLVRLMHIGTCASGNTPYAIARQCPSGTGGLVGILTGSILLALVGAAVAALGVAISMGIGFTVLGGAMLYGGVTAPDTAPGATVAAYSVGIPFIVVGLAALAFGLWWRFSSSDDTGPGLSAAGISQLIAATAPKPVSPGTLPEDKGQTEGG